MLSIALDIAKVPLILPFFYRTTSFGCVLLFLYVDDMIITGNDRVGSQRLKRFLHTYFEMKDLGILHYFLGIEIACSPKGLLLAQKKYIHDILSRVDLIDTKLVNTPMEVNVKLGHKDSTLVPVPTRYLQVVLGSLVYITIARPAISFAVHALCQFFVAPTTLHWVVVCRILRYLYHTANQGMIQSSLSNLSLTAYSDSDWASDINDRRSTTGFCAFLGHSLIS